MSRSSEERMASWSAFLAVALAAALVAGCSQTPRRSSDPLEPDPMIADAGDGAAGAGYYEGTGGGDAVGDEIEEAPITPETVSETMMMRRSFRVEGDLGLYMPTGQIQTGYMAGGKAAIEAAKNVFWGFSFDYVNQDVKPPEAGLVASAEQHFDEIDRYNFLITLDYDWTIAKDFLMDDAPLALRLGLGFGATLVDGPTERNLAAAGVKVLDYWAFLLRPSVDVHWKVWDHGKVLLGAGFDWLLPENIEERLGDGTVRQVDDEVPFSTFFLRTGFILDF